jgi:RNA-directed DNA polymerase
MQEGGYVKDRATEEKPVTVPERAKQAGEIRARWPWVKPEVWTERMLAALEEGVKGGKWFSLIDKVYDPRTLRIAFGQVKANNGAPGEDHQTIEMFEDHLEENISRLSEELRSGRYQPRAIQRKYIPKPGSQEKRPLGIPTVRDRVVQGAIRMVIEPIYERDFHEESYGFRPGRGCKDALRRVDRLLKEGNTWVVDADLKSYFDTIPHDRLLKLVADKVSDGRLLELTEAFVKQRVTESMKSWTPECGTPQGAVLSPLLSNVYLDPLDHHMGRRKAEMVRYADDFVILCRSEKEALDALEMVREWTAENGLSLHPGKTRVVDVTQKGGFDFLGYHFERGYRWPRKKSLNKLKDTVRGKTKRTNGTSLQKIVLDVNATLAGWFEYFKHSYKTTFRPLDSWIRMRLRSILRKRQGGRGRGRGSDHQRWPNAFFAKLGLFSLAAAHAQACQSSRR